MIKLTFLDGAIKEYPDNISLREVIKSISPSLLKKCYGGEHNGRIISLDELLDSDGNIMFYTQESKEAFAILNHTTAHILAHAVSLIYPQAKMGIGPAIEEGFYYDFDLGDTRITEADFANIEKKMMEIVNKDYPITFRDIKKEEALALFVSDEYKRELTSDVKEPIVRLYEQDDYKEVCIGPHLTSTGKARNFKLLSVAGAYWRGDSNNKMLQRIYGTSWFSKNDLDNHLHNLELRKERDHRKIGRELDLFMISDFGPGFPFWLPQGMALKNALMDVWMDMHIRAGYEFIQTPIMLSKELWEVSGHWSNYRENMYTSQIEDAEFAIKPMNCPGGILVYKNDIHSYRDFPLRLAELGTVHRYEASGALAGLFRVRAFTQDDTHIFMRKDQIENEIADVINLYKRFYQAFNLPFTIELSTRPDDKFIGEVATWIEAEEYLAKACRKSGLPYTINPGDGAFYGPKLDFKLRDSMNRIWQCGTIQLDMNLPERFDLSYVEQDGTKQRPVMVHRAMLGSIERFIGIIIEHFGGAFPVWLAPTQVRIIPVSAVHNDYAKNLLKEFLEQGIRADIDIRNEKLSYRIREAQVRKIPFGLVIGDNEIQANMVTYRPYGATDSKTVSISEFCQAIKDAKPHI